MKQVCSELRVKNSWKSQTNVKCKGFHLTTDVRTGKDFLLCRASKGTEIFSQDLSSRPFNIQGTQANTQLNIISIKNFSGYFHLLLE